MKLLSRTVVPKSSQVKTNIPRERLPDPSRVTQNAANSSVAVCKDIELSFSQARRSNPSARAKEYLICCRVGEADLTNRKREGAQIAPRVR